MHYQAYHYNLRTAQANYRRTEDFNAYIADCAHIALKMVAASLAEGDPRLKHLPGVVGAAGYPIKALVEMVAEDLSCPIQQGHSHEDFLREFSRHAWRFIDRDTRPIQDILEYAGLWHRPGRDH